MKIFSNSALSWVFLIAASITASVVGADYLQADEGPVQIPKELGWGSYLVPLAEGNIGAFPLDDGECCSDPGKAAECWRLDAEDDGAACNQGADCISGDCGVDGLCTCESNAECYNGTTHFGVCNIDLKTCGPSYCNGAMVCSCWGGCVQEDLDPYSSPNQMCQDLSNGFPGFCCEGNYPSSNNGKIFGYCSDNPVCSQGCTGDASCNDAKPCTRDECINNGCVNTNLDGEAPVLPLCDFADTLSTDCARQWCSLGTCSIDYINVGLACTHNQEAVDPAAHADCYDHACSPDGICAVVINDGAACDDGNNCTDATCDASGACVANPFGDADLGANPGCCDPAKGWSFDDGYGCTNDTCPTTTGNVAVDYYDRNIPDADLGVDCCLDSANCNDGNNCTTDVCCSAFNQALPACGGVPNYECNVSVIDQPGCCDSAPAALADNCLDAYDCTENICCVPAGGDAECAAIDDYHCAAASAYDVPPAGCCDPSGAGAECDDSSACTADSCDGVSMACVNTPQPAILGCCGSGPTETCGDFDSNLCTNEVCCDPATIAAAGAGDACFGAGAWTCDVVAAAIPGCCIDASDCDDGNPCTEETCVNNRCGNDPYGFGSEPAGCCTAPFGTNDAQCSDSATDPNECTENLCCSTALAADPTSPCFGMQEYRCANGARDPLPADCCNPATVATDCNPNGNLCVLESCVNNNCSYAIDDGPAACCDEAGDCPQVDAVVRPCLDASTCDLDDDPITNASYAQCDLTYKAAGTVCGAGGDCWDLICDPPSDGWDCVAHLDVPAPPDGDAVMCATGLCTEVWCDGSGLCNLPVVNHDTKANDTCTGSDGMGSGALVTRDDADSNCADEEYSVNDLDRFAKCTGNDYSDIVYDYDDPVSNEYELEHRVVQVDPGGAPTWNPFIYTQSTCGDSSTQSACNEVCTFDNTNYNLAYYGVVPIGACSGNESTVTTGPWSVEDDPNHNISSLPSVASQDFDLNGVRDGYDVLNAHNTTLIVDSRYTFPTTGGEADVRGEQELHNSNHCRNTASYVAAPIIEGTHRWKQRWRGNTDGYDNYFRAGGPLMGLNAGASTDDNPAQAFFKVELPRGSGKYLAYVDWYGKSKRGEAGYNGNGDLATSTARTASRFFHSTLTWLDPMGADPDICDPPPVGNTAVWTDGLPPQISIDASSTAIEGWLGLGNYTVDDLGDYELTVIKAQPEFFGIVSGYSKEGAEQGCGTADHFDAEGYRLDFIPSGTSTNGYLMTITSEGHGPDTCPGLSGGPNDINDWGWLVHPYCYSSTYTGGALSFDVWNGGGHHQVWKMLPFAFPMGNKFYPALYFDSTGRIEPRELFGRCVSDASCNAYAECTTGDASCVCVTDLGNQCAYDPGGIDTKPDVKEFFMTYENGGYAPMIAGAWGPFYELWANGTRGYLTAQAVAFEGTVSYVISWLGYDFVQDSDWDRLPNWSNWKSHISYQVIMRADGRIVFYYRPNTGGSAGWDEGVDRNGWVVGVSGGISEISCSDNTDCVKEYGPGTECDNGDGAPGQYDETDTCFRRFVPFVEGSTGIGNES